MLRHNTQNGGNIINKQELTDYIIESREQRKRIFKGAIRLCRKFDCNFVILSIYKKGK